MTRWMACSIPILALLLAACATGGGAPAPTGPGASLGVEVLGVKLMADGDLARLDYRVIDYERAKRSLSQEIRLRPEGGTREIGVMSAGRLGPIRQRPSPSGKKQFIMFRNSGRALVPGGRAVLTVGDARIVDILVS